MFGSVTKRLHCHVGTVLARYMLDWIPRRWAEITQLQLDMVGWLIEGSLRSNQPLLAGDKWWEFIHCGAACSIAKLVLFTPITMDYECVWYIPSGKLSVYYGKSPLFMGKPTINENCQSFFVCLPECITILHGLVQPRNLTGRPKKLKKMISMEIG